MTKVLTMGERKALMNEAIIMLERACDILDECRKRHEARMLEMRAENLGGKHEKLSLNSRQNSRYGRLCV